MTQPGASDGGALRPRYQFRVLGASVVYPIRAEWRLAALDAVAAGCAHWIEPGMLALYQEGFIEELGS